VLKPSQPPETCIRRTLLRRTEWYEKDRCQRAFVWVQRPIEGGRAQQLLNQLRDAINRDETSEIIQAICVGETAFVFETFMRCSQTPLISKLNRVIEKIIPDFQVKKYTLLCFHYDER
jgi:hypothetical protein